MYIRVNPGEGSVDLIEPADCTRFHVEVVGEGAAAEVAEVLISQRIGRAGDDEHVWIAINAVRELAASEVDDTWPEQFDGMVAYATSKGWLDESGTHLRAHLS